MLRASRVWYDDFIVLIHARRAEGKSSRVLCVATPGAARMRACGRVLRRMQASEVGVPRVIVEGSERASGLHTRWPHCCVCREGGAHILDRRFPSRRRRRGDPPAGMLPG